MVRRISIEKYGFIQEMIENYGDKEEELLANSKLEWWNLRFREELAETERPGITFPRNTERSTWWRESFLGDWTLDKQEFVVLNLSQGVSIKSGKRLGITHRPYCAEFSTGIILKIPMNL